MHSQMILSRRNIRTLGASSAVLLGFAACVVGDVSRPMDQPLHCDAPGPAGSAHLRLLTRAEYNATVRDLLGPEALGDTMAPADLFPAENQFLGFDNNAEVHVASQPHVNQYQSVSVTLAAAAVEHNFDGLLGCDAEESEIACGFGFIDRFGRRAFRRALANDERGALRALFNYVLAGSSLSVAVEVVISAVLQSPQFLYRNEHDGLVDGSGTVRLSSAVVASRLSYMLWGTMPDEELLTLADVDGLQTAQAVEGQIRRMLDDPKVREGFESFYSQWLRTRNFDNLTKSAIVYPSFNPALALKLKGSLHLFMDDVMMRPDGYTALFNSPSVFVDRELGDAYDLPGGEEQYGPVSAPGGQRAGLLTQPALMALLGHSDQSSPVDRGLFVREAIMCEIIASPPPGLAVVAPEPDPNSTTRERFAQHTANEQCSSCHLLIDPLGFAFEHYDGMGAWRDSENGVSVDTSGQVFGSADPDLLGPVDGALELSQRLSGSQQVADCMATHVFRYALGRAENVEDLCTINVMGQILRASTDFREMMVALGTMEAFRYRQPTAEELSP